LTIPSHPAASRPRGTKTAELVAAQIVDDIVNGQLAPGTRLPPEHAMVEHFGVSRSSLREALRILEVNGLIVLRAGPQGGPLVGSVDPDHFGRTLSLFLEMGRATYQDLMEARVMIEPFMARLAAERGGERSVSELRQVITEHELLDPNNVAEYLRVTNDFHLVIAGLSGNPLLDLFGRGIEGIAKQRLAVSSQPPSRWPEVKAEHEAIANAIINRDPPEAERLMSSHMGAFTASFSRRYRVLYKDIIRWQ
jgi:DNA-binding FadR family transcriptional regulator